MNYNMLDLNRKQVNIQTEQAKTLKAIEAKIGKGSIPGF